MGRLPARRCHGITGCKVVSSPRLTALVGQADALSGQQAGARRGVHRERSLHGFAVPCCAAAAALPLQRPGWLPPDVCGGWGGRAVLVAEGMHKPAGRNASGKA